MQCQVRAQHLYSQPPPNGQPGMRFWNAVAGDMLLVKCAGGPCHVEVGMNTESLSVNLYCLSSVCCRQGQLFCGLLSKDNLLIAQKSNNLWNNLQRLPCLWATSPAMPSFIINVLKEHCAACSCFHRASHSMPVIEHAAFLAGAPVPSFLFF